MITAKQLSKQFILKACSPRLQHKLRKFHAVYQIKHNRHFREPEMELIKSLVSKGDVVADVGANVGVYTNELSQAVGPKGKVYSFEPVGETYDILSALVRKAPLANVSAFNMAVAAKVTEWEMVIPAMSGFTGYYWAHLAQAGEGGRRQVVKVSTLDELYKSRTIQPLDFVKCDVEGGEYDVIRGGLELIRAHKPGWLIEVSKQTSDNVFRILQELGYRAFVFHDTLIETGGYKDGEFSNYFFLHPQSRLSARLPQSQRRESTPA